MRVFNTHRIIPRIFMTLPESTANNRWDTQTGYPAFLTAGRMKEQLRAFHSCTKQTKPRPDLLFFTSG
jgi:hypothetical protein